MADEAGNGPPPVAPAMAPLQRAKVRVSAKERLAATRVRLAAVEEARDAAIRERDEMIERLKKEADTTEIRAEIDRLRGEIRTRDHRAVFDRLAKERGAFEDSLEMLYQRSGYTPQADAPDAEALARLLDAMQKRPGDARLFAQPEQPAGPPPPPAPGSGQGGRDNVGGKWRVSKEQFSDGAWCMANAKRIQQARQDGTLEVY